MIVLGAAVLASPLFLNAPGGRAEEPGQTSFLVVETAGLRRFGYPVHAEFPNLADRQNFRLTRDGKEVPAQFRRLDQGADGPPALSLDFNASPGPFESQTYTILHGKDVQPGREPTRGLAIEHEDGVYRVSNGPNLRFDVPDNLLGFLRAVGNSRREFLRHGSEGLWIRYKDDIHYRAGANGPDGVPTRATITRQGPLAIGLQFESVEALRGERSVRSRVEMTFVSSKSWVETVWTVDDPEGYVAALSADLNLLVEGEPTLVDFGANSTVYGTLPKGDRMRLDWGLDRPDAQNPHPFWIVRKGPKDRLEPYAQSAASSRLAAEGWAHVMDRDRCTAIAVAPPVGDRASIEVDADGRTRLGREFTKPDGSIPRGPKRLHFWLHVVPMPVQVGAATSPQAMLAPLEIRPAGGP